MRRSNNHSLKINQLKQRWEDVEFSSELFMVGHSYIFDLQRNNNLINASIGEFMCSVIFFTAIFSVRANAHVNNWPNDILTLASAFEAAFQAIACSFAFSSISGAQFNPATSFALWLTGKLSNRRAALYITVQLFASLMAMVLITCMFDGGRVLFFVLFC